MLFRNISLHNLILLLILLFFTEHTKSQENSCDCTTGQEQLKKTEALFENKEYNAIDSILKKIKPASLSCLQEVLGQKLQLYILSNRMPEAELIVKEYQKNEPKKSCTRSFINYLYNTGCYYIKTGSTDNAIRQLIEAKSLADISKDTLLHIKTLGRLSFVFNQMEQPDKAIEFDHLELSLAQKINNPKLILIALAHMQAHFGVWFDITQDFQYIDSIKKVSVQALALGKKNNQKLEISQTYSILAGVAYIEGDYQKSLLLCDSGLLYLNKKKDFRHVFSILTKKCDNYIELKDYKNALQYADTAIQFATLENNQLSIAFIYERMYEIEKLLGNYSKALMYHETFVNIRDSIRTIEKTAKINELEQKYNKAQNEKTIKELSQAKQIASLRNKIYIAGIISSILAIVLIIIFNRQKTLKNKQENMEIEQRLNRARMNPHFFFNTLNSLQTFSLQENKESKVARYLSKYAKIMRETLESTYKEMNTIEQEVDYLTNYLDIQKLRYPDKFDYSIKLGATVEPNETYLPAMIIQPFIENAIEHGLNANEENGMIELNITTENNQLLIEIIDNGSGFTTDKKAREYPSRATQIIKDRLLLLNKKHKTNASFDIGKGNNGKGTCVKISLPLIHTNESFNY